MGRNVVNYLLIGWLEHIRGATSESGVTFQDLIGVSNPDFVLSSEMNSRLAAVRRK